jgi:hypothetical protein
MRLAYEVKEDKMNRVCGTLRGGGRRGVHAEFCGETRRKVAT